MHRQRPGLVASPESVSHAVLDDGLQNPRRHQRAFGINTDVTVYRDRPAQTQLFDLQVVVQPADFFGEWHFVSVVGPQCAAEERAELLQCAGGAIHFVITNERCNRRECVEEKVGLQLRAQRGELGVAQLQRQLLGLSIALLESHPRHRHAAKGHHRCVHHNAGRQQDDEPLRDDVRYLRPWGRTHDAGGQRRSARLQQGAYRGGQQMHEHTTQHA